MHDVLENTEHHCTISTHHQGPLLTWKKIGRLHSNKQKHPLLFLQILMWLTFHLF